MIPAIVLAAGASSRMGRPKPLLPLPGGHTFLSRIEATLRAAGIDDLIAVVGRDLDAIRASLARVHAATRTEAEAARAPMRLVVNPRSERGQLSSLIVGLEAAGDASAVLVTIVDLPLVSADTVRRVLDAWQERAAPIVRPLRGGRHGHPVVFGASLFDALRGADPQRGARAVVRAHEAEAIDVPVDDPGAFDDIDTPEEYERIVKAGCGPRHPPIDS